MPGNIFFHLIVLKRRNDIDTHSLQIICVIYRMEDILLKTSEKTWKEWTKFQRIIPLTTAAMAFIAVAAANLGFLVLSVSEQIILTILGLLAVDALVERMRILDKIRVGLTSLIGDTKHQPILEWETDLLQKNSLTQILNNTTELFVSGGSLISILSGQQESIRQWLSTTTNAKLFLILENPNSARKGRTPVWSSLLTDQNTKTTEDREIYAQDIEKSLIIITNLKREFNERVEVRLTDQVPSLTIMIIDRRKARVFLNLYRGGPEKRPVFELSLKRHSAWFELFNQRYYDQLWDASAVWLPQKAEVTA